MNDLLRPAMYDAYHDIRAVRPREGEAQRARPIEAAKRDAKRPKKAKAPERPRRPEGRAEAPDAAASHGSWAAARAKLEKERSQTFRGTKITFDD